ncbi:alkaline phosphatase D family protein [Vibrio quintilis]|nr:alkaline phosphatase D family protein [Vibrio quintilis]
MADNISDRKATDTPNALPPVIAGPILRKVEASSACFWLACSADYQIQINCQRGGARLPATQQVQQVKVGTHLWVNLVTVAFESPLTEGDWIDYSVSFIHQHPQTDALDALHQSLCYDDEQSPGFVYQPHISSVLHGSCRKPHHHNEPEPDKDDCGDGLAVADELLANSDKEAWPGLFVMSGDQIYADDVAGPVLYAIHQVIRLLGLPDESIASDHPDNFAKLHHQAPLYYQRETILPQTQLAEAVKKQFFGGGEKPVFTSDTAHNHLMTFSEVVAMYLLVWSPELWAFIDLSLPDGLDAEQQRTYQTETRYTQCFQTHLIRARRVMAHLPCAMMFDDHDVTDDWNLSAGWEKSAYDHPISKRIIGNALMGYFLFQGWGNNPKQFDSAFIHQLNQAITHLGEPAHDDFLNQLIRYDQWHYVWETTPALVVLDTRTRRWRSERNLNKPSGLMDWEALTDLQRELINRDSVLLVSPAPVFGVKLIEATQKVFTWFGKPLLVDAENWMAHSGSAHALMNLFKHPKTPKNFVILSGDVHYSFAYHIEVKGLKSSPDIWQITSSGFRNEFPDKLLSWFDRLNRWLYAPWSPLNLLTKRRGMWVAPYKPEQREKGERLLNGAGVGLVQLDEHGAPRQIAQLMPGRKKVRFLKSDEDRQLE